MVQKNSDTKIDPNIFAKALGEIYESPEEKLKVDYEKIKDIPSFELAELKWALRNMKKLVARINPTSLSK